MGRFEKKKTRSAAVWIAAVVILAAVAAAFLVNRDDPGAVDVPSQPGTPETQSGTVPTQTTAPQNGAMEGEPIALPYTLADGKLEVGSLFQSSGINPDCGNQEGDSIATIELTNNASLMLSRADITVTLADGTELCFRVTDLPAGATAMAFSADNISLADDAVCVGITCDADWAEKVRTIPEGLDVSAEGMMVTITNNTAQDIPELIICCRTPFGEAYFGGKAYEYKINDLPANGSTTVLAADCIMGLAEVVRIEIVQE